MKIALVIGGWHFPAGCFERAPIVDDYYLVCHRSPCCDEVFAEREALREKARKNNHPILSPFDLLLHSDPRLIDVQQWWMDDASNTGGDWIYLNQWLERHDFEEYDAIIFAHDDTYWSSHRRDLAEMLNDHAERNPGWLAIGNCKYEIAPAGYLRGSCEIFSKRLLRMLDGKLPIPAQKLNREGEVSTPAEFEALSEWNSITEGLRRWFINHGVLRHISYLSPHYRISRFAIEGERGLLSNMTGAPWSVEEGLEHFRAQLGNY